MATQIPPDDFGSNLASMDRNQIQELINYLGQSSLADVSVSQDAAEPRIRPGTGMGFFNGGSKAFNTARDVASHASAYGMYKRSKKSKADKKAKAEYENQLREEVKRRKDIQGNRLKQAQGQMQTLDLRDKVNTQFRDMELEGLFDRVVNQGLDSSLLGITQQHQDLSRETGFQAVKQGLGGSSTDAERVSDIGASQDQAVAQAASQAQQARTGMSRDLDETKRSLLAGISGGNPGEQARLTGELQNIQSQAQGFGQQMAGQTFGMQQSAQQLAGQSQALGGLLSNYARLYNPNTGR